MPSDRKPIVCVDARATNRMSFGAKLYSAALKTWLPKIASDIAFDFIRTQSQNPNIAEQIEIPLIARRAKATLLHYTFFPSLFSPCRFVLTLHDLHFARFPELLSKRSRFLWLSYMRLAVRRASMVIVDDDRTVADCMTYLGVAPETCRVIPLGYDPALLAAQPHRASRPYIMYAGNRSPHKRVDDLIAAWSALPSDISIDLYLTDSAAGGSPNVREQNGRALVELGHLSSDRIWSYLAGAALYVQPSLAEGFGLPMLEAAALGVPLIATKECAPAILRDTAMVYEATNRVELRERIESAVRDLPDRTARARALSQGARTFTWERCAVETARCYRHVMAAG